MEPIKNAENLHLNTMEPIKKHDKRHLDSMPAGSLGIIPVQGCEQMASEIDYYLTRWRAERESEHKNSLAYIGYKSPTYIIDCNLPRFGTGEGKGVLSKSVRGMDLYLLAKRVIASIGGKARRITVIMPYLYESRQHKRTSRESLDCAIALQELVRMGVDNIITFDANDPRVMNAIPLNGFDTVQPAYQFIKGLLRSVPDLKVDKDHMLIISPDEGGMKRAVYYANVLGLDMGMFYKRRDYSTFVDGVNPVLDHVFLGSSVEGKDMVVIDDMLSSGDSILEVAGALKKRNARRVFICETFGLFTDGIEKFDKAYAEGKFDKIITTNLIYQKPELKERPWYVCCGMSKYLAYLIDTLNHDSSISDLLDPREKILNIVERYNKAQAEGKKFY